MPFFPLPAVSSPMAPAPAARLKAIAAALSCCLLGACGLVKVNGDARTFYSSTVLVGRVASAAPPGTPLVVAAFSRQDGALVPVHHTVLHEPGGYELLVPRGEHVVAAFADANGNLRLDAGEQAGQFRPGPVVANGTGTVIELNFTVAGQATDIPVGTAVSETPPATLHSTQAGAIADLDAPVFSPEFARIGYWTPTEFFRNAGGNVYFLEKYDPARIPVLFIHGVGGSPQDWRYFFDKLDRKRYQPWFFYYPSGAALDSVSYLLYWKLINLQRQYHFERIVLTAHSMGGLVARNFLSNHGSQLPVEKTFVSLSTPWGGDAMADQGVAHSPAVVPSWNDMQAGGRFIQSLYRRALPGDTAYYLFFGHAGRYSLLHSANTDGAVTLASELRPQAQAEARMIYGFDEDHTSILRSPQVFARYAAVLDAALARPGTAPAAPGGHLRVALRHRGAGALAPAEPLLVLTPADAAQGRIVVPLLAGDRGRRLGPFAPGVYDVAVVSPGFSAQPARRKVAIAAGQVPELDIELQPVGTLFGYIGADVAPGGNPAGSFREPHPGIDIEAITLSGAGIERTLVPDRGRTELGIDSYLAGKDDAARAMFSFVGLPDGDYALTITAPGYHPYRATHTVVAGQSGKVEPIVLARR
ncbi:alpha/beta hydrolase [Pseudoduganella sp. SL102]|uniref:PGAP1-like alpha/beta domain-containing protein n=1 Tax=Pseudoduganella sp. SL102 TaxID=2995154 RepID=UPI00248B8480|nr:alpha/beta hydrolase [Pseudoduganella sp. SL102]WBR99904.1 alpha/beta hydrolase [Pseudoduganella sp. SL102]